jgi:general transcription factor 3C polypeptide 3 (transcription factor C subunit 4)
MHGTIAEVLIKKGRTEDALGALFVGVHATRDPEAWRYVVEKLLEIGPSTRETRQRLQDCYSTLLDMDSEDYLARLGRMKNYRNSGQHTRARNECLNLLKRDPYDTEVLGHFAEVCFKLDEPATALPAYEKLFSYCLEQEDPEETRLSWQFLDFYADLLIQLQHWEVALNHIRTVSRWLLGRADEAYWDSLADDREWDAEDEPRRIRVSEFSPGIYDVGTYGQGLLIELRAKMGLARLGMGQGQHKEAMVCSIN